MVRTENDGENVPILHLNQDFGYQEVPGWVQFVDALPTTGTQKVQKAQIFPPGTDPRGQAGAIDLRSLKKRQ